MAEKGALKHPLEKALHKPFVQAIFMRCVMCLYISPILERLVKICRVGYKISGRLKISFFHACDILQETVGIQQ